MYAFYNQIDASFAEEVRVDLFELVGEYLEGMATRQELYEYVLQIGWECLLDDLPKETWDFVYWIELIFAEYTGGYLSDIELKQKIEEAANASR